MPVVSASFFRPPEAEVTLPSMAGTENRVLLRKPNVVDILAERIELLGVFETAVDTLRETEGAAPEETDTGALSDQNRDQIRLYRDLTPLLNAVVMASMVEPKPTEDAEPGAGEFYIGWMDAQDKTHIFQWAMGDEFENAARFRREVQGDDADGSSDGEGVRDATG
ncbi:MAG: hypothetical protein AAGK74_00155 [Chloroflexota bacterium]